MEKWEAYLASPDFMRRDNDQKWMIIDGISGQTGVPSTEIARRFNVVDERENFLKNAAKVGVLQNLRTKADSPEKFADMTKMIHATSEPRSLLKDVFAAPGSSMIAMGPDALIKTAAASFIPAAGPALGGVVAGQSSGKLELDSEIERMASEAGYDPTDRVAMAKLQASPEYADMLSRGIVNVAPVAIMDALSVYFGGKGAGPVAKRALSGIVDGKMAVPTIVRSTAPIAAEAIQQGSMGAGGAIGKQIAAEGTVTDWREPFLEFAAEGVSGPVVESLPSTINEFKTTNEVGRITEAIKESARQKNIIKGAQMEASLKDHHEMVRDAVLQFMPSDETKATEFNEIANKPEKLGSIIDELNNRGFDVTKQDIIDKVDEIHKEKYGITRTEARAKVQEIKNSPAFKEAGLDHMLGKVHLPQNEVHSAVLGVIEDRGISTFLTDGIRSKKSGSSIGGLYSNRTNTIALNSSLKEDVFYSAAIHEMVHAFETTQSKERVATFRAALVNLVPEAKRDEISKRIRESEYYGDKPEATKRREESAHWATEIVADNPKAVFQAIIYGTREASTPTEKTMFGKMAEHLGDFAIDFMRKFDHLKPVTDTLVKSDEITELAKTPEGVEFIAETIGDILEVPKDKIKKGEAQIRELVKKQKAKIAKAEAKAEAEAKKLLAEKKKSVVEEKKKKVANEGQIKLKAILDRLIDNDIPAEELTPKHLIDVAKNLGLTEHAVKRALAERTPLKKNLSQKAAKEAIWFDIFGDTDNIPKGPLSKSEVIRAAKDRGLSAKIASDIFDDVMSYRRKATGEAAKVSKYYGLALDKVLGKGHGIRLGTDNRYSDADLSTYAEETKQSFAELSEKIEEAAAEIESAEKGADAMETLLALEADNGFDPNQQMNEMVFGPEVVDRANGKKTFGEFINSLIDMTLEKVSEKVPFFNVKSWDQARAEFQDRFLAVRRLEEAARRAGIDIDAFMSVYVSEANMRGKQEAVWNRALTEVIDPVNRSINALNLSPNDIQEFLLALRAPEYNLALYGQFKDAVESAEEIRGAGISDGEAMSTLQVMVDRGLLDMDLDKWAQAYGYLDAEHMINTRDNIEMQHEAHERAREKFLKKNKKREVHIKPGVEIGGKMGEVRKQVDKLVGLQRSLLRKYGLVDGQLMTRIVLSSEYYVPMRGSSDPFLNDQKSVGQFLDIRGADIYRPTGRTSKTEINAYSQLIGDVERIIIRGEKNLVGNKFYRLAQRIIEKGMDPKALGIREIMTVTPQRWAIRETGEGPKAQKVNDIFFRDRDHVFATKINGVTKYIVLDSVELATALKALGSEVIHPMLAWHASVQRQLARMSTSLNIDFAVANVIRDGLQSGAFAHTGEAYGNVSDYFSPENLKLASKAIWAFDRSGGVRPSPEGRSEAQLYWDEMIERFAMSGGRTGWMQATSLPALEKKYKGTAVNTRVDENTGYIIHTNMLRHGADLLETMTGVTETVFRLINFERALQATGDEAKAAFSSRNLTVDFNRRGNSALLSMAYIFANASVQGTTRFLHALGHNKKVQRLAMQLMGVSFGAALWNRMTMDEDEWDTIPDYMKERSILISTGGKNLIEIPIPWGFNVLHVMGTALEGLAFGNKTVGDATRTTMTSVVSAFNPLGGTVGHSLYGTTRNFVPTVPRIVMDIAANESWTGQPIHTKFGTPGAPGYTKGREGTPSAFTWGARAINTLTGGGEVEKGALSVYPEDIEYLLRNAFGGVGSFLTNTMKTGENIATWFGDDPQELDTRNVPILRRLTAKYSPEYNLDTYFRERDKFQVITSKADAALEGGDYAEYQRLKKEYPQYMSRSVIEAFKDAERNRRAAETIEDQGKAVIKVNQLVQK